VVTILATSTLEEKTLKPLDNFFRLKTVFYQLLGRRREVAGSHGFRFKNKLDRSNSAAPTQGPATERSLWLASVESLCFVAPAVVRLSRPNCLDR
jgi:hypothetical protein